MARSTTLCLSSNSPNSAKSSQDTERTLQGALSGTKLARETKVPIVIQTSQRGTLESSQETGSSPAFAGTDLASKCRQTTALCLAAEKPELLFGACNTNVKNTILNSRAPFTRNIYACRWKLLTEWCTQCWVIPEQCSVPLVLCFLSRTGYRGKCVLGSSRAHYSAQVSDRCDSGQNREHIHFQKERKNIFLPTISVLPLCSQSAQPFQPLAMWAEA